VYLIRLRLSSETLPLDLQPLLESYAEGCFILKVNNYSKIESVLAALRIEQIRVLEMELMQPDLEDVFVKIMGNTKNMEPV
jgi:ABC-2 type transport system ATP-binding protein